MPAVELHHLTKRFEQIVAVNDISFSIGEGEMFGVVGPDGAGKTTMIRMLCGVLLPSAGSATLLGMDVLKDMKKIKREIGYLSQRFSLYGDLTVDENIEFFAEINEVYDYAGRRDELLDFTRLTPFRDRLAEQLSGGMKQKLALACTLIHQPKIIFLDEPTTGVDPVSRRDFWKILSDLLRSKITIVMSTPYLDEAERCSRVALLDSGSLLVVDTPQKIREMLGADVVEIVCSEVRRAARLLENDASIKEVQTFGDRIHIILAPGGTIDRVLARLAENGISVNSSRRVKPSLENVFIDLMKK